MIIAHSPTPVYPAGSTLGTSDIQYYSTSVLSSAHGLYLGHALHLLKRDAIAGLQTVTLLIEHRDHAWRAGKLIPRYTRKRNKSIGETMGENSKRQQTREEV